MESLSNKPGNKLQKTAILFGQIICTYRLRCSRGSVLAFGTQVRGFKPGRSRRIFGMKKSLARLPSERRYSRRSHVTDLRHVKDL